MSAKFKNIKSYRNRKQIVVGMGPTTEYCKCPLKTAVSVKNIKIWHLNTKNS